MTSQTDISGRRGRCEIGAASQGAMMHYTVCARRPRNSGSPANLTPGFPSLFGVGGGDVVVLVEPLHLLPNGKKIEREIAGYEGVEVPQDGLAVVQFCYDQGLYAPDYACVAADRWCHFARLLGWRIWLFPDGGTLPLQEVDHSEVGRASVFQGVSPKLIVAKRSLMGALFASVNFADLEKDAAA